MFADHRGQLEAVEFGHAYVEKHDRNVRLEKQLQRSTCGAGLDKVLAELVEDGLVAEQLGRLIVDQQNVDLRPLAHGASGASTSAGRTGAARC